MLSLFLFVVIVAVAFGIVGFVVKGLLWLLALGCLVFVLDFVILGAHLRGRRRPR